MELLRKRPYNLKSGEMVVVRISAPLSGWKIPSDPNVLGARIIGVPKEVGRIIYST